MQSHGSSANLSVLSVKTMLLQPIASPAKQSEAITTHQIVTSVLISPSAQVTESNAQTSGSTNTTKQR